MEKGAKQGTLGYVEEEVEGNNRRGS